MNYLSIAAIIRDESDYLIEWINAHRAVGVEHFYLFDNESSIPVSETLKKYEDAGIATIIYYRGKSMQMPSYTHCLNVYGKESKWIAFIDCDEFLIPKEKDTVSEVLQEYENYGGFNVSWRIFGSSGHVKKPNGLVMENYTFAMPKNHYENTHTKAIVQPDKTLRAGTNPHYCVFKPGHYSVSEDFKQVSNAWTPHCSDKLQLNHYFTKSFEEFQIKIQRHRADAAHLEGRKIDDFKKFDDLCIEKDECALKFVEKTKTLILK